MERRAHERFGIHDQVCITVLPETSAGTESETFYGTTDDLSESGLRFSADSAFHVGQVLRLLVVRGAAFWGFSFVSRVVWVRPAPDGKRTAVGVQFVDVPQPTAVAWKELIERAWEYRPGAPDADAPAQPAPPPAG
jgi:Tfp pilus assembly protein PilZ